MKGKQIVQHGFSHYVHHGVSAGSQSRRFRFPLDATYFQYKPQERTERIQLLRDKIPTGPSLIYRGSEGTAEVLATMKSKRLGRKAEESRKTPTHNIIGYVRDNDSSFFLSFTPCKETVKPYTVGLSLIPKTGYIFVTALPKVYTTPQKLLLLNEKMFERYDKRMLESMPLDEARGYQSIVKMTKNNNEITGIIGASLKDDWRSDVDRRVHSVIEVCGPGRIASKVMSSNEPAHVRQWTNEDFSPELFALDIVFADTPEEFEEMNEKAVDMGLMPKGFRLPTIEDACAVMRSNQLGVWEGIYGTTETMKVASLPSHIKPGDTPALLEFMEEQLKSNPSVKPLEELRSPFSQL
ncbi:hypothetical protein [Legionella cherrii]|uniref:Uncharacterized protein n=1 Tax=Legionella cherrii TaxID=28084 RepID=A0A0W0SGR7_9GAMM|nr:hypothetical protein [Legionella cherrii]KTC82638.1 hypothetical protein Lche_0318 [Legionella cherrii]VEB35212.1 Uncharacterised protein [Legionella cherrii]